MQTPYNQLTTSGISNNFFNIILKHTMVAPKKAVKAPVKVTILNIVA